MKRLVGITHPFLIVVFISALYLRTLAPGLTWAYDGADGGDLLAALATGGVPHPGGYPTYLLFASLLTKLPLGSLALRGNLFSCLCMLLAILVLYKLILEMTSSTYVASLSALLFGCFPLVWSQALITEVYALQTLLSLFVLFFMLPERNSPWQGFAGGLFLGLAIGNHMTALFLLPFLLLMNVRKTVPNSRAYLKFYFRLLAARLPGLLLGLGTFLIIPLRARNQAPVNWGNPVNWNGFWWLTSGAMYHGRLSVFSVGYLLTSLRLWSQFLLDQMSIIGLSIAVVYIVVFFRPIRLHIATLYLMLVYSLFAILYFSPDSYIYLILPLSAFAVWIALGCEYLLRKLPPGAKTIRILFISASFALIVARTIWAFPEIDISTDHAAEQYAQTVLESLPERAIVIAYGDEALFSLWYFHYALDQRSDVAVISDALLVQPWYHTVLKGTYPGLNVPDSPWSQDFAVLNPERLVCILDRDLQPQFECLRQN